MGCFYTVPKFVFLCAKMVLGLDETKKLNMSTTPHFSFRFFVGIDKIVLMMLKVRFVPC